jgi:polyhydroxyalkanoate synthesis regulator protein
LLSGYLEQAFAAMLQQQDTIQQEMTKAFAAPLAPLNTLVAKNMEMWTQMQAATHDLFATASRKGANTPDRERDDNSQNEDKGS